MKKMVYVFATLIAPIALSGAASAQSEPTAAQCQPLTVENISMCCEAANWQDIILSGEIAHCPPIDANDQQSGRLGQPLGTATADTPDDSDNDGTPETTGSPGNPGNEPGGTVEGPGSEVGSAGESPGGGNFSSQDQGKSN